MDTMAAIKYKLSAVLVLSLAAVGCQSSPAPTAVRYDNGRFMDVWGTYTRCLSTDDAQSAALYSGKLHEMSQTQAPRSSLDDFLPTQFKHVITQPSSRMAVDVQAMAASCSLHTGTLALTTGNHDLAQHQFTQILHSYPQPDYAYYAEQARELLTQLKLALQASLR
jgi:hypothetical protein